MPNTHETLTSLFADIADAIRDKTGGTEDIVADEFPDAISEIETGGGGGLPEADENDVIFIDYDGTIRYSYSKSDFLVLTEFPANPDHSSEGLVSEGWNWTLAGAQEYVRMYDELVIGQTYHASDEKCHIFVQIPKNDLSCSIEVRINGSGRTATIDYGDGSPAETLSTTSGGTTAVRFNHTFSRGGKYEMVLDCSHNYGISNVFGSANSYLKVGQVLRIVHSKKAGAYVNVPFSFRYMNDFDLIIPKGIYNISEGNMGSNSRKTALVLPLGYRGSTDNSNWFANSGSLKYISYPEGFDGVLRNYAYQYAYSLRRICPDVQDSIKSAGSDVIRECRSLSRIVIPAAITSIGTGFASGCVNLKTIKFYSATPPTVSNSNAWTSIPTDCKILVPRGYLTAYTTATNYPDSTTYTYEEFDIPT